MSMKRRDQSGGVSIFIVIFSALLITIVTVSFVSLMVRNQTQSSNADLSASAYDSAMAGVEDAKRLMLVYKSCLDGSANPICNTTVRSAMTPTSSDWTACNSVKHGLYGDPSDREYLIRRTEATTTDDALAQAYTCVKIRYNTDNIEKTARDGQATVIPIDTNGTPYDTIKLSWFKRAAGSTNTLGYYSGAPSLQLPSKSSWTAGSTRDVAPVMRLQFMQIPTASPFNVSDFDTANSHTAFYYPALAGLTTSTLGTADNRGGGAKSLQPISCSVSTYANGGYACTVTITLPGDKNARSKAYLNIGSIYKDTDYKIELLDGATSVKLAGIQPEVDSTGRANDLFRRVSARVEFIGSFDYPDATLEVTGNLCKELSVTDQPGDYRPNNTGCTP